MTKAVKYFEEATLSRPLIHACPSIEEARLLASANLDPGRRVEFGQFMTPWPIARFMASMFEEWSSEASLLDPGSGVGSLSEAFARRFVESSAPGSRLTVTGYEIDPALAGYSSRRFGRIKKFGVATGMRIDAELIARDFIREGAFQASLGTAPFSHVILNPPYRKIGANSEYRNLLRRLGIETVNLYTAFLGLAVALTRSQGEIVAIIPRSFCNGRYFRPFRRWLLDRVAIEHVHVFESRKRPFSDDSVLQENVIIRLVRGAPQGIVRISTSNDSSFSDYAERLALPGDVIKPADVEKFIHVPTIELASNECLFARTLDELGLDVATGPVVDFRVKSAWSSQPRLDAVPLLYAHHFRHGKFAWPQDHNKKPNALRVDADTKKWLMPRGWYAITKRFSSKEERRRLVAYVIDPNDLDYDFYGFENHLNVIHAARRGIDADIARGIALFLNSTIVDQQFRAFSGHTQINATDLRAMRFPSKEILIRFGKWSSGHPGASQTDIDLFIEAFHG